MHWVAWNTCCDPKVHGGMGFREIVSFNRALLARQGWQILSKPNALLSKERIFSVLLSYMLN